MEVPKLFFLNKEGAVLYNCFATWFFTCYILHITLDSGSLPTPVILPGESQGRGSLVGCRLWGCTDWSDIAATAAAELEQACPPWGNVRRHFWLSWLVKGRRLLLASPSSIAGLRRSPREGNGNPFQYSCLENSMDRGPGGLQFKWSQRVGCDWITNTHTQGETGVTVNNLQCKAQPPQQRIIWSEMSLEPKWRNSSLGQYT